MLRGVQRAGDVLYVRRVGRLLAMFGAWTIDTRYNGLPSGLWRRVVLAGLCVFAIIPSNLASLRRYSDVDKLKFGHIVLTCMLMFIGVTKCFMFFSTKYWALMQEYLGEIHLFNHTHRNEYCNKVHGEVHWRCHALSNLLGVVLSSSVLLYNARPVFANYMHGAYSGLDIEYEYSVYFAVPHWDVRRSLRPHVVLSVVNMLVSVWCVATIWCPDLFAMQVVLHIWGHMQVLVHEMECFGKEIEAAARENRLFSQQQSAVVREKLKHFVDSHRKILRYVNTTSETFSLVYFCYFLYFQLSLCLMMWECSQGMEGIIQYGFLTAASVFSLTLLCGVMERIATENDVLVHRVYALPWQYMRLSERRTMCVVLMRAQVPVRMKALGLTDVGVPTMAAILRTSISYFMFLRSME